MRELNHLAIEKIEFQPQQNQNLRLYVFRKKDFLKKLKKKFLYMIEKIWEFEQKCFGRVFNVAFHMCREFPAGLSKLPSTCPEEQFRLLRNILQT